MSGAGLFRRYTQQTLCCETLCFLDGTPGLVVHDNQVGNRGSDVDFNNYHANSFSTGIEGGRLGIIVDLGDFEALANRYHYSETAGGGQGFFSLRVQNDKIVVLKDLKTRAVQEIAENAALFNKGEPSASAPIKLGHIYLIRITDRFNQKFQRLVKLMVIAYDPGQSVTIRWQLL